MNWIRKALTRRVSIRRPRSKRQLQIDLEPSERLVYSVYFAMTAVVGLVVLEVAHMAFLGSWNTEIFAAISGLIGTIIGILLTTQG